MEGTFNAGYEKYFDEYSRLIRAFLKKHNAVVIRRQLITKTLYGMKKPNLIMLIDFPDAHIARSVFFESEYLSIVPLRDKIFEDFNMFMAECEEI